MRRLKIGTILIVLVNLCGLSCGNFYEGLDIEHQCMTTCPYQVNRTVVVVKSDDYSCEETCKIEQCCEGCKLWRQALDSSCQKVCNGTSEPLPPRQLYCAIGCMDASDRYFSRIRTVLKTPLPPALVADSLTPTSLRLEWHWADTVASSSSHMLSDGRKQPQLQQQQQQQDSQTQADVAEALAAMQHARLTFLVQWRYEEQVEQWQYCRNQTWNETEETVLVDDLQPYTKYRFRVALLLPSHTDPIVSEPSVVINTPESGVPVTPPTIVRALPVDCNRVSVSWEPGPFPRGPILSYVLHITDNKGYTALKDINAENLFHTFRNLKPDQLYNVSVKMSNKFGVGPAAHVIVATPMQPAVKDSEKIVLILAADHDILEQGTEISDEQSVIYTSKDQITGVAIHVSEQLLFVSDTGGHIRRLSLNSTASATNNNNSVVILSRSHNTNNFQPLDLSVDWLNRQLYILGEVAPKTGRNHSSRKHWQVARCSYDGSDMTVAVAGLRYKPHQIEVDPYNGYLFWVVNDGTNSGLFRLDLINISNGIKHEVKPEQISKESNLGAFAVDHSNFRLLVSNQNRKTVNSVSLDGKEVYDMRTKVTKSGMEKVISLAYANKSFYWTDGESVFFEEYHSTYESYFHNTFPENVRRSFSRVLVNLASSQPTPVPVNPPTAVQAIFGPNSAKISWQTPHLLGGQGKGAWQNWSYQLSVKDIQTGHIALNKPINTTSHTISHLLSNRSYLIKASAYTSHGDTGPWSSEFKGRSLRVLNNDTTTTLTNNNQCHHNNKKTNNEHFSIQQPMLFWSTKHGLLRSDATGDCVETLLDGAVRNDTTDDESHHQQKGKNKGHHQKSGNYYTDMAWYGERVYLVTNGSKVVWYDVRTRENGEVADLGSVGSVAIDWIGKKLYWSNPKKQLINRGNLNGSQQEPLPIITLAKELNIDSINAYLYWSTGYDIECAHLNGADKIVYHAAQLFAEQVMGLTLDMDLHHVYWIVRGSDGSNLYRAPMASPKTSSKNAPLAEKVYRLSKPNIQGPLSYFNNRLLWLQDEKSAIISDLQGKNMATISGEHLLGLNMVYIMDPIMYKLPNTTNIPLENISVIPEPIDRNSITLHGHYDSFNISWKPVEKVNFGTVFYEVKIDTKSQNDSAVITSSPTIHYWATVDPFTPLHITIRPFTYWSCPPLTLHPPYVLRHSPPSTPSAPLHPHAYVTHHLLPQQHLLTAAQDIEVTLRWRRPLRSNGVLAGYRVRCWLVEGVGDKVELCGDDDRGAVVKGGEGEEYKLSRLLENETYYFQVQAFTKVGDGGLSPIVSVNTHDQSPVPTLLLSTPSAGIYTLDIDNNRTTSIFNETTGSPVALVYLLTERRVFWIEKKESKDSKSTSSALSSFSTGGAATVVDVAIYEYNLETGVKRNLLGDNKVKGGESGDKVVSLSVDWLERCLYYVVQSKSGNSSKVNRVNLNYVDRGEIKVVTVLERANRINKVEVSPFTKKLYWTETNKNHTTTLMTSFVNGSEVCTFLADHRNDNRGRRRRKRRPDSTPSSSVISKKNDNCNCPIKTAKISTTFTLDHSHQDKRKRPLVVFIDTSKNEILAADKDGCICTTLSTKVTNHNINNIRTDFNYLYWTTNNGNLFVFTRATGVISIKEHLHATGINIYGTHMQPYPNTECLTPRNTGQNLTVSLVSSSDDSVTLAMPVANVSDHQQRAECRNVSLASVEYHVYYKEKGHRGKAQNQGKGEEVDVKCEEATCAQKVTFDKSLTIGRLKPYTEYVFAVAIGNYFSDISHRKNVIGRAVVFRTTVGAPSPPTNVTAHVLNPTLIAVSWLPPAHLNGDYIRYEIHWQTEGLATGIRQKGEQPYNPPDSPQNTTTLLGLGLAISTYLRNVLPNETYTIWVRAYSSRNTTATVREMAQKVRTYPEPGNITTEARGPYKLSVKWPVSGFVTGYRMEYALLTTSKWENVSLEEGQLEEVKESREVGEDGIVWAHGVIYNLKPKTLYKFRVVLKYPKDVGDWYVWPRDPRFTFETLGDKPSIPGKPIIQHINDNYQVWWEASKDNGAPIELYKLELLKIPNYRDKRSTNRTAWSYAAPSIEETEFEWEPAYNGTETYWKIVDLTDSHRYIFRVSARNSYGWSDFSDESSEFDFSTAAQLAAKQDITNVFIAIFVTIVLIVIATFCILVACNCCRTNKKQEQILVTPRGPDVELATLRELPRRGNFIHNTNLLYISTQINPEQITLLPHIRRDQITLTKFLGSGAFGEVFEGTAKGVITGNNTNTANRTSALSTFTKVAVKTLRKGASDQEKTEFLQEAQLMSLFKHEHILQLLGVCLDNDPHFIIMELMEGGDLLTYLRLSRKSGTIAPPLTLLELMKMCVDVARGCKYLEEMHFVHRDLACRNCLVSSTDPASRIVKIGDFGLARDIYKNDYYRKEGEGLLPVRWMAPESLVDGVFTCQSDVWAFGVLLWEIMTLGQQPYPARNNLEVLHYVRRGGRLGKPTDCPETLHSLMLECWNYESERRPTFKHCLDTLERLFLELSSNPVSSAHTGQYISTVPLHYGVSNQAYFQDENHNHSGNSWKSGSETETETSRERTPFLTDNLCTNSTLPVSSGGDNIPKYLQLLYDSEMLENDGYEVPRTLAPPIVTNSSECRVSLALDGGGGTCDVSTGGGGGGGAAVMSVEESVAMRKSIESLLNDSASVYTNMSPVDNGQFAEKT